jgi:hypothetical protein
MNLLAAAAFLALQAQPLPAPAAPAAPSEALIERFIAVIPDRDEFDKPPTEIDPAELSGLVALNPGKEAQVRKVLKANLACTGPAIKAGGHRMLRTVARELGEEKLKRLVGFYEGPDYAVFKALAERMEGKGKPSAEDSAAMARLMGTYPLQAFMEGMNRAPEIIAADQGFMTDAMKCASEQMDALEAAGLKSH